MKSLPEHDPQQVIYHNGQIGRCLCTDRPNTAFHIMTMGNDGALYHHTTQGHNNLDQTESAWDIIYPRLTP